MQNDETDLRSEIAELRERIEKLEVTTALIGKPVLRIVPNQVTSDKRRGHSPIARLLSGGSMKAKANGVLYTHEQLSKLLAPGIDVLAYGLGLVGVAASPADRWSARAAYIIGEAAEALDKRRGGQ
jgi:hypothetical protein